MRLAAVLLVTFACSTALASEPGQPLDCSDWVFLEPGYSCVRLANTNNQATIVELGSYTQFDNQGRFFRLTPPRAIPIGDCSGTAIYRTQLEWLDAGSWRPLAYVDDRCVGPGKTDSLAAGGAFATNGAPALTFDDNGGRMFANVVSYCNGGNCSSYPPGSGDYWLASFSGFTTTFAVLQTYTPQASLGFRVPYMPEGMAGADHFDTYWGDLTKPLDFTQAHPLQCGYPAAPPHVGDYLTVADTVPTPGPGQGVYYVTSATYQGATRYGRKTTAGHLAGRDSALLPACNP